MSPKNDPDRPPTATLGLNTKITFSLLIVLISPLLGLGALYYKLNQIQNDIQRSWTIPHQAVWADRLSARNPNLIVPNVAEVVRTVNGVPPVID